MKSDLHSIIETFAHKWGPRHARKYNLFVNELRMVLEAYGTAALFHQSLPDTEHEHGEPVNQPADESSKPPAIVVALYRIEHHAESIFIRETVDGVLDHYALTELPANLAIAHVCRLIRAVAESTAAPADNPVRTGGITIHGRRGVQGKVGPSGPAKED